MQVVRTSALSGTSVQARSRVFEMQNPQQTHSTPAGEALPKGHLKKDESSVRDMLARYEQTLQQRRKSAVIIVAPTATGSILHDGILQRGVFPVSRHCELREDPAILIFNVGLPRQLLTEFFLEPGVSSVTCDLDGTLTIHGLLTQVNRDKIPSLRLKADSLEGARVWQLRIHLALGYAEASVSPPQSSTLPGPATPDAIVATRARAASSMSSIEAARRPSRTVTLSVAEQHGGSADGNAEVRASSSAGGAAGWPLSRARCNSSLRIGQMISAELGGSPAVDDHLSFQTPPRKRTCTDPTVYASMARPPPSSAPAAVNGPPIDQPTSTGVAAMDSERHESDLSAESSSSYSSEDDESQPQPQLQNSQREPTETTSLSSERLADAAVDAVLETLCLTTIAFGVAATAHSVSWDRSYASGQPPPILTAAAATPMLATGRTTSTSQTADAMLQRVERGEPQEAQELQELQ